MDRLFQFLTDNKDAISILLGSGVVIVIAGALFAGVRHLYRQRLRRPPDDFVDVVTDPDFDPCRTHPDIAALLGGGGPAA